MVLCAAQCAAREVIRESADKLERRLSRVVTALILRVENCFSSKSVALSEACVHVRLACNISWTTLFSNAIDMDRQLCPHAAG